MGRCRRCSSTWMATGASDYAQHSAALISLQAHAASPHWSRCWRHAKTWMLPGVRHCAPRRRVARRRSSIIRGNRSSHVTNGRPRGPIPRRRRGAPRSGTRYRRRFSRPGRCLVSAACNACSTATASSACALRRRRARTCCTRSARAGLPGSRPTRWCGRRMRPWCSYHTTRPSRGCARCPGASST